MLPLLSTSYLPPIPYVAACIQAGEIVIEQHEHFIKQTHRNRALIYGANGILPLIVPVQHANLFDIPISEARISFEANWQKIHWRSMVSAYRNSPFFDYYEDDFAPFYQRSFATLCEFNLGLLNQIFRILGGNVTVLFTSSYEQTPAENHDLRNAFSILKQDQKMVNASVNSYRQVFSGKHGFIPNLSIVDLLFNEGPESGEYLFRISQSG